MMLTQDEIEARNAMKIIIARIGNQAEHTGMLAARGLLLGINPDLQRTQDGRVVTNLRVGGRREFVVTVSVEEVNE